MTNTIDSIDARTARLQGLSLLPPATRSSPVVVAGTLQRLKEALVEYGIDAELGEHRTGPRIIRIALTLGRGVRLRAVRAVLPDIALRLGVAGVRLVTEGALSLEVPRTTTDLVSLGDVLSRATVVDGMALPWAVGLSSTGEPLVVDLANAPHVLMAGATGSGKSAAMTALVMSLMLTTHPDDCELVLIDPKRVDLAPLLTAPHVRRPPAVTPQAALEVLTSLVSEMRHRYVLFEAMKVANLADYNTKMREVQGASMRRIVVLVDELADLVAFDRDAFEAQLITLAQVARAAGIHLVCATQRPTAQVVSTQLRSQLNTRLVFAVNTATDSRVALDQSGAETLLGQGDGLFRWAGRHLTRIQSPFVTSEWRNWLMWTVHHDIHHEQTWTRDTTQAWSTV